MNEQMKNKKKEEKEKQLQLQIRRLTRQAVLWLGNLLLNHLSNFESNFQKLAVNCLHPTELWTVLRGTSAKGHLVLIRDMSKINADKTKIFSPPEMRTGRESCINLWYSQTDTEKMSFILSSVVFY